VEKKEQNFIRGLYLISTPIGNLGDITFRAVEILKNCDLILSEDTRKTSILLKHYQIHTPQKSYRIHQLKNDTDQALAFLKEGKTLALCTDAGTPGISDPGSYLIRAVRENLPEIPMFPVPGPSSLTAALSVSGFQANPSLFLGFLSPKSGKRRKVLEHHIPFEGCIIIFESVHRIRKLLGEIFEIFPDRDIFIAREMTKLYEEYLFFPAGSGPDASILEKIKEKGEFVLIIGPVR